MEPSSQVQSCRTPAPTIVWCGSPVRPAAGDLIWIPLLQLCQSGSPMCPVGLWVTRPENRIRVPSKPFKWYLTWLHIWHISWDTSYLTYLLRYITQNHPHVIPMGNCQVPIMSKIYFILPQLGYKWRGPGKTFPMISHLTSYLTYLLRYDLLNPPPTRMLNSH